MKKIVFALQVFGLITLFPALLVFEMNHETSEPLQNRPHSGVKENTEKNASLQFANLNVQNAITGKIKTTLNDKQECNNPDCTCKKCRCGAGCKCRDGNRKSITISSEHVVMRDAVQPSKTFKK